MANSSNDARVKYVYGNTKHVTITLQELVNVETGEVQPFNIETGDIVSVNIRGTNKVFNYIPTIDENMLSFKVGTELSIGKYVVEVGVVRDSNEFMSRKRYELEVVRYDDQANIPDDAEFTTDDLELIAMMYIKGDPMTYDDMTEEQKEDLADRMGVRLSIDDNGYLCYGGEVLENGLYKIGIGGSYYSVAQCADTMLKVYVSSLEENHVCVYGNEGDYVAGNAGSSVLGAWQGKVDEYVNVKSIVAFVVDNSNIDNWDNVIEL